MFLKTYSVQLYRQYSDKNICKNDEILKSFAHLYFKETFNKFIETCKNFNEEKCINTL